MKDKKIIINMIFYIIKQISAILFPMIVYPFVTRRLGASSLGAVEYSKSLVNYFLLFAGLGISDYAIREGARIKTSEKKFNQFATQIIFIHLTSTIISSIGCVLLSYHSSFKEYQSLLWIFTLMLPFTFFGVGWIFNVFEEYKYISVRSMVFQIISAILTFMLIRNSSDYLNYAIILVISNVGANILNLVRLKKYFTFDFSSFCIIKHIKPILLVFGITLASNVYMTMDTTMLGLLSNSANVGYYSAANKLIVVIGTLIAAIRTVLLPRLSFMLGQDNQSQFDLINEFTIRIMLLLSIPMSIGIFYLSDEIILLFCGSEYSVASIALKLLSPEITLSVINGFLVYQVLLPLKCEFKAFLCICIGAMSNLILNYILIPAYVQNGAAIATCISELIVLCTLLNIGQTEIKKHIKIKNITDSVIKSIIAGLFMFIFCTFIGRFITNYILKLIVVVLVGVISYLIALIFQKDKVIIELIIQVRRSLKKF